MKTKLASEDRLSAASLQIAESVSVGYVAAAAAALFLVSNLFATWFVSQERSVYFWDFRIYWMKYIEVLRLLQTSLWQFASNFYWSVRGADYNDMAAYIMLPFSLIFGTSRLSFILAIVNFYAVPAMLVLYFAWRAFARPAENEVPRGLWIYAATVFFSGALWNPVLWGYVDVGGLIPVAVALWIYIKRPPEQYRPLDIFVLGLSLAIAVLFRRWYSFWSVTLYLVLGLDLLLSAASGRIDRRDLSRGLVKVAAAGVISAAVLLALAYPITIYMLRTNYAELFSYNRHHDSYLGSFLAVFRRMGTLESLLFVVSAIYCLSQKATRRVTALLLFQSAVILFLFLRIQDFDAQHLYLLEPVFLLCTVTFLTAAVGWIGSSVGRGIATAAYVSLAALAFASVFIPQVRAAVPSIQYYVSGGHLPMRRDDFDEIERIVKTVNTEVSGSGDGLYVLADSETLNSDTIAFAPMSVGEESPIRERVYGTKSIDVRDGFPSELFKASHIMVAVPIQLIADKCQQRYVDVPARQMLEQRGMGQRFTRLDYEFKLTGGVHAYLYRKIAPISEEDRATLVDEARQPCVPESKGF